VDLYPFFGPARLKASRRPWVGPARLLRTRLAFILSALMLILPLFPLIGSQPAGSVVQIATTSIAPGGQTNCAIRTGGAAYCWGDNSYGQLGDGTTTSRTAPTLVPGNYTWSTLSTEDNSNANVGTTCGVTTTGAGYCWGSNNYGQVGDGTTTQRLVPTAISGGYTWSSISVGWTDVCGVTTSGAAYCWGYNNYGQDGTGNTTQNNSPTLVTGSHSWSRISVGMTTTCGVAIGGSGFCWGYDGHGNIGDNNITQENNPTSVSGGYTWASITTGSYDACGVTTSGAGYCWGYNNNGQDGDGTSNQHQVPNPVSGSYTWSSISMGSLNACGLTTAGDVYCWGYNSGAIGDGTTTPKNPPTAILGGNNKFSAVATGSDYSINTNCAITTGGVEYCWGYNNFGQVGDRSTTARSKPTAVNWVNVNVATTISSGGRTNCAIRGNGVAYCWGDNSSGQVGDGSTAPRAQPSMVIGGYTWASISTGYNPTTGDATTCGVTTSGAGYCWGSNKAGQVGDGTTNLRSAPTLVSGSYTWKSISVGWSDVCGVTTTNVGYCWGANLHGEVGNGTTSQATTPALVSGSYNWSSITTGYYNTCGVTTTNVGYCWGYNAHHQLGNGTTNDSTLPTAISGSYNWSSISTGIWDACGVTTSGSGYCWGYNNNGEVGDGSTTERNVPTSISGSYTWNQIAVGFDSTCGVIASGAGYCWGANAVGQIGDGTTTNRTSPTQVSGSAAFTSMTAGADPTNDTNCGLTTGGTEFCWGYNNKYQVGDQTTTNRNTPTAIVWPTASFTTNIATGGLTNCAIRTGGAAYCWGINTTGQIGDGTTTNHAVPTLVSGGYTWRSISTEYDGANSQGMTCGITITNAGYCWGSNKYGQVGDGTTTQRTTPTLISGGYTWLSLSVGSVDVCGVTTSGAGYCWGFNGYGENGNGTTTQNNSPTLISGGYTWSHFSLGITTVCGVTTSGGGYCWGNNTYSQIGDGTSTARTVPTAVSGSYTWSDLSPGYFDSCGVTTSGAGYCWGYGIYGEDGNGTTSSTTTPVAVSGGYTWTRITEGLANTCGLTTSGVAYCWGYNAAGEVGNGTTSNVSSPTAVNGGLTFSSVLVGQSDVSSDTNCGVTITGAEYCWGNNSNSQVGDQTTTNRSAPVAVIWAADTAPTAPASLAQYQSNGTTAIGINGYMTGTSVVLAGQVSDADPGDTVSLCVELEPASTTFTNLPTQCSLPVSNGATATVSFSGMTASGSYEWQAETVDASGSVSSWTQFNSGATAFSKDMTPPTTGAVYDGSTSGVQSNYNSGSLSSLSCNWTGFSDAGSGLASYDYSFGTTAGATDILGWTNTAVPTANVTANSLTLNTSQLYYCNVRAYDAAGNLSGVATSAGQMVTPTVTFTLSSNSISMSAYNDGSALSVTQSVTLSTSTNALHGYKINVYEKSALTSGSGSISDYSSSISSPTTWTGLGFGYSVSGGSAISNFAGGTKFAHFGSAVSPDTPVIHSATVTGTPIANEQETLTLKVAAPVNSTPGTYTTSLVWTCVPNF
jgi:alpha-tubulin suppressor-like RCC1 family protein